MTLATRLNLRGAGTRLPFRGWCALIAAGLAFGATALPAATAALHAATAALPAATAALPAATAALPAATQSFAITLVQPAANTTVTTNELAVVATASSEFQIQSVTASVLDRQTTLTFSQTQGYTGTVDLTGLARGTYELRVTVTDVMSNSGVATRLFTLDRPPVVTVLEPLADTVSRGTLRLRATCTDDDPVGCTSLRAYFEGFPNVVVASGISEIDQTVSTIGSDGQVRSLLFVGGSANGTTSVRRPFHVDSSPRLGEVLALSGRVLDFNTAHVLFADPSGPTTTLKIRDRSTGLDTTIPPFPGKDPTYGYLTPRGAIFVVQTGSNILTVRVVEFRDGAIIPYGFPLSLRVKGQFAIWTGYPGTTFTGGPRYLFVRDVVADTLDQIGPGIGEDSDVAANGDVVYAKGDVLHGPNQHTVHRYQSGAIFDLPHVAGFRETSPLTDGTNIAYRRNPENKLQSYALLLYAAGQEIVLNGPGLPRLEPFDDFQLENGWTAFTRLDGAGIQQVWTRDPSGSLRQRSFSSTHVSVHALNGQGDTIFTEPLIGAGQEGPRRLVTSGTSQPVGMSRLGNWRWLDGAWYVAIGRSLFDASGPRLTSLYPASGQTAGGTTVMLTGTNFGAGLTVTFDGAAATALQVVNATTATAVAPAHTEGLVDVRVSVAGATGTLAAGYRYVPAPVNDTVDTDGDSLPDSWELRYSLDSRSAADRDLDTDADSTTNLQEFQANTHPHSLVTRYLAEGASSPFFEMRIALLNPTAAPAGVLLRYLTSAGTVQTQFLSVPPLTRATVDPATTLGASTSEFSTTIEADYAVVVDRLMSWDRATGYGSHAETGILAPATTWYLAEGATHSGFNLFYLVQNPSASEATVEVTYLMPAPAAPLVRTYAVGANSRRNIWVNVEAQSVPALAALAATDVSAVLRSTNNVPIIVERAMYLDTQGQVFGAGHESAGVTAPATDWFFGEGATGDYFDLFILIANPNPSAAHIEARFLLPSGTVVTRNYQVDPNSRFNIWVDTADPNNLANTAVSTTLRSLNAVPVIAERAMWWPGPTSGTWQEAHNSPGATGTASKWALAEGEQGGARSVQTYILLANTSAFADAVRVTLVFEDGTTAAKVFTVHDNARFNVEIGSEFPAAANRRFGAIVESLGGKPAQLVVERALYFDAGGVVWAAGSNAMGTRLP